MAVQLPLNFAYHQIWHKGSLPFNNAHKILVLITSVQKPPINVHAGVSIADSGRNFGLGLHLHSYFVYASIEGSDESAHLRRLVRAFVARQGNISCAGFGQLL